MALLGSFSPTPAVLNVGLFRAFMVVGGIGTILTAGYFLWMLQRVNLGEAPVTMAGTTRFRDILAVEWVAWVPLLVADRRARAGARTSSSDHRRCTAPTRSCTIVTG